MPLKQDHRTQVRYQRSGACATGDVIYGELPALHRWELGDVMHAGALAQVANVMAGTPAAFLGLVEEITAVVKRRDVKFLISEIPVTSDPDDCEVQGHLLEEHRLLSEFELKPRISDRGRRCRLAGDVAGQLSTRFRKLNYLLKLNAELGGRYSREPLLDATGVYRFLVIFRIWDKAA